MHQQQERQFLATAVKSPHLRTEKGLAQNSEFPGGLELQVSNSLKSRFCVLAPVRPVGFVFRFVVPDA